MTLTQYAHLKHACADIGVAIPTDPIQCPELGSIESGQVIVTPAVRRVNSTAEYTCDSGYKLDKRDAKRTCQPDGTWSGEAPECSK